MKEISLNILDIAQNSVKAKATEIGVFVIEDTAAHSLEVKITDNGCGMDEETVKRVSDPFYTSRTTRKVGLGIPFFKMEAEMTGGRFYLESKSGEGTTIGAVFYTNTFDSIPLGDIVSTILVLIQGSPDIDFRFAHTTDGHEVGVDTAELRATLGEDVPLSEPDVIAWIREYLEEQYRELGTV
ncbi:histidine kinase [Clostridia bacterium]|nr:histidine kinase [Clostridia bacterium]